MEHLSGGDILIRALKDVGVKHVWGYPGGAALHIYDAIYRQEEVVHLLVRHEQAAVHAADGFSRATGEVGTALVTSGPENGRAQSVLQTPSSITYAVFCLKKKIGRAKV